MSKKTGIVLAGLAVLALLAGAACTSKTQVQEDKTPIKLGWLGALTGDVSSIGTVDRQAAELAVKEINDAGGVNGRQLEMIYEDAACDAKIGSNAGNKLINIDKVVAIVGGLCSGETLAVAPVAEQNKVIMMATGATSPAITNAGDFIFRVVASDSYQGKYAANFVYNTLGKRKAAVVYAKTDYTEGLATVFSEEFKKLGGEVVLTDTFLQTDRDLKTQLTKVKESNAEIMCFFAHTEAGIVGLKQAKELGLSMPILGPETFSDPKVVAAQGTEGVMYTLPVSKDSESFKNAFLAFASRTDVPVYAAQTYDAVKILAQAIKNVGTDTTKIKDELYKTQNYDGVSGSIGFDSNGDLMTAAYDVMVIKNNKAEKYQQ